MKKNKTTSRLFLGMLMICFTSCSNIIDKNQGIYTVDKTSLSTVIKEKMGTDNALGAALLDKIIENAVFEFKIQDDSIKGVIYVAGETVLLNTKIEVHKDTMVVKTDKTEFGLVPNEKGIAFTNRKSEMTMQMVKSKNTELSKEVQEVMPSLIKQQKEHDDFMKNIGKWQKGNLVDEFGDNTGKQYLYLLVKGTQERSSSTADIFVKASINDGAVYFYLYNSAMTLKDNFPDKEFGTAKIKYPNGDIKTEKIFFYKNGIYEAPDDKNYLIYNHITQEEGELKIMIDMSTASEYYDDKYQFSITTENLKKLLAQMKGA